METLQEFLRDSLSGSLSAFANVGKEPLHVCGASIPMASMMVAGRFFDTPENILVVAKDYKSAEAWIENLQGLVGEENVLFYPSIGLKPYEQKVPFEGVLEERLKFFERAADRGNVRIAVCPLDALLMKLPEPGTVQKQFRMVKVGDVFDPASLRPWLLDHGFNEQPMVSGVGEFSIRGCIVDINCFLYTHPIRIEFYGDEVESIRTFDIFTQRSIDKMDRVNIYPMGEFCLPVEQTAKMGGDLAGLWWKRSEYQNLSCSLLDYLPNCSLVFENLSELSEKASKLFLAYGDAYDNLGGASSGDAAPSKIWWNMGELSRLFPGRASLDMTGATADANGWMNVTLRPQDFSSTGTDAVAKQIEDFAALGGRVYVVAPTPGALSRLRHVFEYLPVEDYFVGNLTEGFWLEDDNIAFLTETRIFNRHANKHRKRQIAGSVASALMVESLSRGDYVAHEDHGVGRYLGLVRVNVNGGMVD